MYRTLKSTVVQYSSWHTGAGIKCTGKKSYLLEEREKSWKTACKGSWGQVAVPLTPDIYETHISIFESWQLEGSYVGNLLYSHAGQEITDSAVPLPFTFPLSASHGSRLVDHPPPWHLFGSCFLSALWLCTLGSNIWLDPPEWGSVSSPSAFHLLCYSPRVFPRSWLPTLTLWWTWASYALPLWQNGTGHHHRALSWAGGDRITSHSEEGEHRP